MPDDNQNSQQQGQVAPPFASPFNPTPPGQVNTAQPTPPQQSVVSTDSSEKGGKRKRAAATIIGIILLVGGLATGVYLVSQQQEIRIGAWDCSNYVFDVNEEGTVVVRNGSTRDEPAQQAKVYINGNLETTFDVPALNAGEATTLGDVRVGNFCTFNWEVIGTKDCRNSGTVERKPTLTISQFSFTWDGPPQLSHATTNFCDGSSTGKVDYNEPGDSSTLNFNKEIQSVDGFGGGCTQSGSRSCVVPSPTPGVTATPTPIPSPTPIPTLPPIGAACHNVQAYDTNWNLLTGYDLSNLSEGDVVRFAVGGTTDSGSFDRARFTINGTQRAEVTTKRPGTNDFYDEYTVPAGVTNFTIDAEIHHTSLGWI